MQQIEIISNVAHYQFISNQYNVFASKDHFWVQWRLRVFLKQTRAIDLDMQNLSCGVEIGCGQGIHRFLLEQTTSWIIDGVEIDEYALRNGRPGRGHLYLYDIMERNPQFLNKYDFIILYDVLEHIEHDRDFLKACLFHLKPGGYIFINVPALPCLWSAYDHVQGHHRRYTKASLAATLNNAGIAVLDICYWGFFLIPLLGLRKILCSLKRDSQQIYQLGFQPPNKFFNDALKILMKLETSFFYNPPSGTSLMAVGRVG